MQKAKAKFVFILALLLSVPLFTGGTNVFAAPYVALQTAITAMSSDSEVNVANIPVPAWADDAYTYNPSWYWEFKPTSGTPTEALILYPGANLNARAYSKICHDIAAAGYLVAAAMS